jgi:hypothetical protein
MGFDPMMVSKSGERVELRIPVNAMVYASHEQYPFPGKNSTTIRNLAQCSHVGIATKSKTYRNF